MIVTDKLVFIHLHRTGGRFIRGLMLQHIPDAQEIGYHFPATLIPEYYRNRPVIGFVRNPWDWYRSWYNFNQAQPRSVIYRIASSNGTLDVDNTLCNLLHLGSNEPHYRKLRMQIVDALPRSILGNRGAGITQDDLANFNDESIGYYSWLVQRMYARQLDSDQLQVGRFEQFRQELQRLLLACGYRQECPLVQAIGISPATNTTGGDFYAATYGHATRDRIARQESWICERFNYQVTTLSRTPTTQE